MIIFISLIIKIYMFLSLFFWDGKYCRATHQRLKLFFSLWFSWKIYQLSLGSWRVQIRWNFCDIFFSYWNTAFFRFSVFVNSVRFFVEQTLSIFLQCIAKTPLNSKPLEFLWYIVHRSWYTVWIIQFSNFWQCALQCIKKWCPKKVFLHSK